MNIQELAKQAGMRLDKHNGGFVDQCELIRFAALVLEEAAKVCDERYMGDNNREDLEARRCAAAIRALKGAKE